MAMTLHVDIVSAEAAIYSGTANMVFAPAEMGEVGIAPRHTPLLTRLKPGEVRVQIEGQAEQFFYVSGGMLEVQPHVVTVLADVALRARDIDEAAAMKAKERAEKIMADKQTDFDFARAEAELAEAVAQLRTLKKIREKAERGG
jgi:F-type H+-transporting ATPase subunit epsilon